MNGWLNDWLTDLTDWLTVCLVEWNLTDCRVGTIFGLLSVGLARWLTVWLFAGLADWVGDWLIVGLAACWDVCVSGWLSRWLMGWLL